MRRLLGPDDPSPVTGGGVAPDADVDVAAAYRHLPGGRPRPAGRPWVTVLMIASADGAVTVAGRSGALGNDGDRAVYRAVRALGDAVLVGAATVRAETYRPVAAPRRLLVVTGSGDVGDEALLAAPTTTVVMPADAPVPTRPPGGAAVLTAGAGRVDLAAALASLDGVDHVVCEGGPSLNGQLLAAGLVDEICLTLAPLFVAGDAGRIATGPAAGTDRWRLVDLFGDDEGYLFLRYLRAG